MRLIKATVVSTALSLTALSSFAFADEPLAPDFATLDRQSSHSTFGVDMGITTIDDVDAEFARIDLHGQYVLPEGYGVYGNLPMTTAFIDDEDNETAIGNLELGGMYNIRVRPDMNLNLHAGLLLPTADDDFAGVFTNVFGSFGRITDLATSAPESTWLRVGVSPTLRSGNLFARADLGFDVAVDSPESSDTNTLLRANVGAGIDLGQVAVMGEVVTLGNLDADDDDEQFIHTGAVTARFDAGNDIAPSISISTPLDDDARGEAWTLTAGVHARF